MEPILDLEMSQVSEMLAEKHLGVELSPEARHWLVEHGYDPVYGARPMKRLVKEAVLVSFPLLLTTDRCNTRC